MPTESRSKFIGASITPVAGTADTSAMARGEPGLPRQFRWGESTIIVEEVLAVWKTTGDCRHGSGEQYVRRHWYDIRTDDGRTMTIYFDRQPKDPKRSKRWWLFEVKG